MNHQCPQCGYLFKGEELLDRKQPVFKKYRLCPHCDTRLIVDRKTRLRQIVLLILSIILLIVFFLPYDNAKIAIAIGLIVILMYVLYANKKIKFEVKDNK